MGIRIITVSREFGSGGRTIAKMIANRLGINYYDKELVTKIAQEIILKNAVNMLLQQTVFSLI